jgi:hypothetical protein
MPAPKRPRRTPTEDWEQLRLFVGWPEQETYELLRPIVLFGQTAEERTHATGVAERTLGRKADRFDAEGMASLFEDEQRPADDRRLLPADIRHRILALKAEYAAFRPHEIAEICRRRDDCRVSHKTVQRVLASHPLPPVLGRRYPLYAQMEDPTERRLAIVHLYFDGWNIKSIAGYLETTRPRVYETLHRFFTDGFAGMADQSRAPKAPARKADFKAMAAVRRLQANADLGEFRIHAALAQLGIHLSPRTCGRIMAHNRVLGLPRPADPPPHERRTMPFAATYRHEYWSVDVRYIEKHQLENPQPVYVLSVLENYSRALLASLLSPRQDLTAYLLVLRAALHEYGAPTGIVSDGGGIFRANQVLRIYKELGIERHQIEAGRPWQNYIETHFNVMRRMADYHYAQAETWAQMRAVHDRFFADYNLQAHFAHRRRPDGKRSPKEVLGWVHGVWCDEAELDRLFRLRSARVFDQGGYLRYKRWRIYGERGLAGQRGAVWLFGEVLTVAYEDEQLAQYQVHYAPDERHIRALSGARLFENRYPSPQPFLWDLSDVEWHLVLPLPSYHARRHRTASGVQAPLFPPDVLARP